MDYTPVMRHRQVDSSKIPDSASCVRNDLHNTAQRTNDLLVNMQEIFLLLSAKRQINALPSRETVENEQKIDSLKRQVEHLLELQLHEAEANEQLTTQHLQLTADLELMRTKCTDLEAKLAAAKQIEDDLSREKQTVENLTAEKANLLKTLHEQSESSQQLYVAACKFELDKERLMSKLMEMKDELSSMRLMVDAERAEFGEKLLALEEGSASLRGEVRRWQCEYDILSEAFQRASEGAESAAAAAAEAAALADEHGALLARLEPFCSEVRQLRLHDHFLRRTNREMSNAFELLNRRYADLLTNTNAKQKLKHFRDVVVDNHRLRSEALQLRGQNVALVNEIRELRWQLSRLKGSRVFDPADAFKRVDLSAESDSAFAPQCLKYYDAPATQ